MAGLDAAGGLSDGKCSVTRDKEAIYHELLVLRCRRRDGGAFGELIDRWERPLFYYVRHLVDSEEDAWDVLQKCWMTVARQIRTLHDARRLPAWLYRIARNTAISHTRREHHWHAAQDEESLDHESAPDDAETFEDAALVHDALGRISVPRREVLTLHFLDDLSIAEIAEVVDIPEGTVKSRLHHAKRALRKVLDRDGSADER